MTSSNMRPSWMFSVEAWVHPLRQLAAVLGPFLFGVLVVHFQIMTKLFKLITPVFSFLI